jgi:two-component system sensor histidine kinase VicK
LLTGAIVAVGGTLVYVLALRVQRPVLMLAEAAARIRDGDLLTPMPVIEEPELAPLGEELERARSRVHARLTTIADAESRQQALFAALREPVVTTSEDGRITSFNAAAARLLGDPIRLYGERLVRFLPFVDAPVAQDDEASDATTWHGSVNAADGTLREIEVARARVAGGALPPIDLYVVHDLTQHVELRRMREQLLYSVAHEVRSPLMVLDNVLDVLVHDHADLTVDELSRLARSARSTVARLHNVVESLLSAGSIQSGRLEVHPTPVSVASIVDEAVESAMPLIEAREQRISRQLPVDELLVAADRRYVRQLLWNLLSNASKYSPDGALIRLQAELGEGHARVLVRDTGRGIPEEQQAGLFERFYRTRSSAQTTEGIGLGLAIAKAITDAHGGTIGVTSVPGEGTCVWFTLPLVTGWLEAPRASPRCG